MERYKKIEGERYWWFGREGGELETDEGIIILLLRFGCGSHGNRNSV